MAPRGRKRKSEANASAAAKRFHAEVIEPKCKDVCSGISMAESLPEAVKDMLIHNVRQSLNVPAADRHPYQVQAVEMMRETLTTVEKQLQTAVAEAQSKVDSSDRDKASRNAAVSSAQGTLAGLAEKNDAAKAAVEEDTAAVATAKGNLSAAQVAFKDKESEVASMSDSVKTLETALKDLYEPLKTSKATKTTLNTLTNVFTDAGLEAGLIDSLPETFKKDPSDRRTYDALVVKHVEEQTAAYMCKTEQALKGADSSKTELESAKTSAEAELTAAQQKLTDSTAAARTAKEALKEGKDAAKAADGTVTNFDKEMANAGKSLEHAKSAAVSFAEGALQSFAALKVLEAPPAEQEEPEEGEMQEEATAEDAS